MMHYLNKNRLTFISTKTLKFFLSLVMLLIGTAALASGQHSVKINSSTLNKFHSIDLPEENQALRLNYIGSTINGTHLFLENKVAVSKKIDKDGNEKISMPWNHIFQHKISNQIISIKNGWTLDLSSNSYKLKPKYCPAIQLTGNKPAYTLPDNKNIKKSCLSGRYIHNRK